MVPVLIIHEMCDPNHVGYIPGWLDENDPRPARDQLHTNYVHGGGWRPFKGFELRDDLSLKYPGDPAHPALAVMKMRDEMIITYQFGWVAIIQLDGSFEVSRMD